MKPWSFTQNAPDLTGDSGAEHWDNMVSAHISKVKLNDF